jgi:hypothetical protein
MCMIVFKLGGTAVCSYSHTLRVYFLNLLLTRHSIAFPSYGSERGLLVLGHGIHLPTAAQ